MRCSAMRCDVILGDHVDPDHSGRQARKEGYPPSLVRSSVHDPRSRQENHSRMDRADTEGLEYYRTGSIDS